MAAVLAQIALAFYSIGLAIFAAPLSGLIFLTYLCIAGSVAVIWLVFRDPWLAPLAPIVSFAVVMLIYEYGKASLGWGA